MFDLLVATERCFPTFKNESLCFLIRGHGFMDKRGSLENQGLTRIFIIMTLRTDGHEVNDSHTDLEPLDLLKSDFSGPSYA